MKTYSLILFFILFISCNSNKFFDTRIYSNPAISQNSLKKAIVMAKENIPEDKDLFHIISIVFTEDHNDIFVYLNVTADFYDSGTMLGYQKNGKYLLVFYDFTKKNYCDLIYHNALKKDIIKGYDNEYSDIITKRTVEPWGWKYKVVCPDSLKLIKVGFLD